MVGGSNENGGINKAEIFIESDNTWKALGEEAEVDIRMTRLLEWQGMPLTIGGVECRMNSTTNAEMCERTDSVYMYFTNSSGMEII